MINPYIVNTFKTNAVDNKMAVVPSAARLVRSPTAGASSQSTSDDAQSRISTSRASREQSDQHELGCGIQQLTQQTQSVMLLVGQFIIEDVREESHTQTLNGGVIKKFTSLATTSTIFRWTFGDTHQNPIIETTENPYYHTFREAGTYIIGHQSCYPCGGQLVCSNGWCTQSITITSPGKDLSALAAAGIFGFLVFKGTDCEPRNTKETCEELIDYCRWIEKEKKCVRKCNEGYTLEKEDNKNSKTKQQNAVVRKQLEHLSTDDIKKPFMLGCVPTRKRLKPSKEKK